MTVRSSGRCHRHPGGVGARLGALAAVLLALGCTARQVTVTERSGAEQEPLVRSLERAAAGLDVSRLRGRPVSLELVGLTRDAGFAREFLAARLQARGVDVVTDRGRAALHLRVFASILGIDRGDTLLGVPAFQVPVLAIPVPEIPLFKWVRHRGTAEMQVFVLDPKTDRFVERFPDSVGRAKLDQFTVLLVIGFSVSDLDERPPTEAPSPAD